MNSASGEVNDRVVAGAVLAGAREALHLSVLDVARQLKLSPAQVEALESGTYERLPGRVFVRGFLRNYAKLVKVDPQPLLRSIEGDVPKPELTEMRTPDETVMPRGESSRWPLYSALGAVIVVGCLAVYEFGFNEGGRGEETRGAAAPNRDPPRPGVKPISRPKSRVQPPAPRRQRYSGIIRGRTTPCRTRLLSEVERRENGSFICSSIRNRGSKCGMLTTR